MIRSPTTLILGAGASAPFRFPTGYGLLREVIARLDPARSSTFQEYLGWLEYGTADISKFRNALQKCGKTSVDAFLEHRSEFIPIGKAAIAATLIGFENENELFQRDGKSWYEYLFNQLNTTFDDFGKNKLSILTFNYDRSLEHFLLSSLKHTYDKSDGECAKKLREIPIVHLHGLIGNLSGFGGLFRNYDTEINPTTLRIAADGIKIVHEGIENDPQFEYAQRILSESQRICFLGFGFHPLNVKRLGFGGEFAYSHASLSASTYGLTGAERNQIDTLFSRSLSSNHGAVGCDVLQFLRATCILQHASR